MQQIPKLFWNLLATSSVLPSVLVVLLSSCAPAANTVNTDVLIPAGSPNVAPYRERLAVLRFDGNSGPELSSAIEAQLSSHSVGGKSYFSLVDRNALDKVLGEIARGQSGIINSATAAKVGKLSGAKGILLGNAEASSQETRISKKALVLRAGRPDLVDVSCTRRTATFTVAARLIGVENGSVVYSNTFKKTATDDLCEGDILSSFASPRDLLEQAKNAVLKAMLYDLAPHYETFNLPLIEDASITPKGAAESYLSGLEFAKSKRLDRACEFWQKAHNQNASHYAILYSLGICSEVNGNLSEALRWYTQADRALNHPDEVISAALSRIREQIRNKGK